MNELIPSNLRTTTVTRPTRQAPGKGKSDAADRSDLYPPKRPPSFFMPGPEVLEGLIKRGLEALSRGIYWDRGSIINLLL